MGGARQTRKRTIMTNRFIIQQALWQRDSTLAGFTLYLTAMPYYNAASCTLFSPKGPHVNWSAETPKSVRRSLCDQKSPTPSGA